MSSVSISFVLPMYNEEVAIEGTIAKLASFAEGLSADYEIIVADDASSDRSGHLVDKIAEKDGRVKVVHLEKNTKFGGALREGIRRAGKEVIVYTDSDLPVDLEDIRQALFLLREADVITGYSKVKKGENLKRVIMSKGYNFLIQFLFKTNIRDINSGFKIYKRKIFEGMDLVSNSPFVDVEIFIRASRRNFSITEYPVIFNKREGGKSCIARPAVVLKTASDMLRFYLKR